MNLKKIDNIVYCISEDVKDSIKIDNSAIYEFCNSISTIELTDLFNYCKQRKVTNITSLDILNYCKNKPIIETPSPIKNIGIVDNYVIGKSKISNDSEERKLQLDNLLDELNIQCLKDMKDLNEKLTKYSNELPLLYKNDTDLNVDVDNNIIYGFKDNLIKINNIINNYNSNENDNETRKAALNIIQNKIKLFDDIYNLFDELDNEIINSANTTENIDIELLQEKNKSLTEYINSLSPEELEQQKEIINNKTEEINNIIGVNEDSTDFSNMSKDELSEYTNNLFLNTLFYTNTNARINLLQNTVIPILNFLFINDYVLNDDKEFINIILIQANRLLKIYKYQLNGYSNDIKEIQKTCPNDSKTNPKPVLQDKFIPLLDDIKEDSTFEITKQDITIEDKSYWVKFCEILTIISVLGVPFWSTGIPTPISPVPLPLPTIYINLGVITTPFKIPHTEIELKLPFIIVPCLAITGMCISPFIFFLNLSNMPIGPIGPNSATTLLTWRAALITNVSDIQQVELKPLIIDAGVAKIDLAGELTRSLKIFIRDDFPAYERLKITNIPFIIITILNMIMNQKQATGFP